MSGRQVLTATPDGLVTQPVDIAALGRVPWGAIVVVSNPSGGGLSVEALANSSALLNRSSDGDCVYSPNGVDGYAARITLAAGRLL